MTALGLVGLMAWLGAPTSQPARWAPGQRIPVAVDPRGVPATYSDLVHRAFATWERSAAGAFTFEEPGNSFATGIRVWFAEGSRKYGETRPQVDRTSGRIRGADVIVLSDPEGDPLQKQIVVYLTALHEIGHALGLPHTDNFDAIMYRFRAPSDGPRYFLRYRRSLRGPEDIGTPVASGLFPADLRALAALYPP